MEAASIMYGTKGIFMIIVSNLRLVEAIEG